MYPDGSKLVGEFREDQANGDGVLHFKNGDVYEGGFRVRPCIRLFIRVWRSIGIPTSPIHNSQYTPVH